MEHKFIKTSKEFQSSVNIAFDLYDDNKIKNFIPTLSAIKLIEEIFLSTNFNSTQRARILVGAYGRGKSHIVLVILSLLLKKDIRIFNNILSRIKNYNEDMYQYIFNYLNSEKKILPIVISGNGGTLSQAFLIGLQQTLKNEGLEELMPKTNYYSVIKTINNWQEKYPETYVKLKNKLEQPINEFLAKIEEYDLKSYRLFEKIYPELTSGSNFSPFLITDIIELYENITLKLKEKGYLGIYIVYDEFSKFLEGNIEETNMNEIKLLQDFAEKCNRSGYLQMHLLLISHKELSNYLSKNLSKEILDAWRGVSGRFLEVGVQDNFEQTYEIISQVIKKDEKFWKNFQNKFKKNFEELENSLIIKEILLEKNLEIKKVVRECYPLHPITTFILPRLSEKIAQNERTLFTFLSANQKYSLNDFLNQINEEKFKLLTPDYVFDYFDFLLRKENYNSEIYKIYKLVKTVLLKVEEKILESKILKTIALIYIVEQFEKLAPTQENIIEIFKEEYSTNEIIDALKILQEKECVVYLKLSNNYLKIKESSGVDIEGEILKYKEKNLMKLSAMDLLNSLPFDNYLYPTRYNDENEIIRYFDFIFVKSSEIYNKNYLKLKKQYSDGVVFGIIPASQEDINTLSTILSEEQTNKQIIFVIPKKYKNINNLVYRYKSVEELKIQTEEDKILEEEYELILKDLQEVLFNYIDSFIRPERMEVNYYYLGQKQNIYRKAHLSNLLSKICEEIFYKTPIINNEMINKNILSTATLNSRNKLVGKLLDNILEENLGLKGNGQEVTIMRSLLLNNRILEKDIYGNISINLQIDDKKLNEVLKEIDNFFCKIITNNWTSFEVLYDKLLLPENNIGLKKGIIPIYLALLIHKYKKYIIIKSEIGEEKIDVELLNKINNNPEKYFVYVEDWNNEKNEYLKGLSNIFLEYISGEREGLNNFKYQVLGMKQWYLSLPKYSKESIKEYLGNNNYQEIKEEKINFLKSLKLEIENPREYLFEKIFKIFGYNEFNLEILKDLKENKNYFENILENLKENLINDVKRIFNGKEDASLVSIMKDWEEELNLKTKEHIFNKNENRVLDLISNSDNNEKRLIEKLARVVSSLRIEDWNKNTIERFLQELKEIKYSIEEFDKNILENLEITENNSYQIIFTDEKGKEKKKTFEKIDYSRRATLLYNDLLSSIDEMGESISQQEIRQILIEILQKFC